MRYALLVALLVLFAACGGGAPAVPADSGDGGGGSGSGGSGSGGGGSGGGGSTTQGPDFVNWENLGVHPLDLTPNGATLLVCNTPDNRLEIFDISSLEPVLIGSVPVGLDPVSVRARTDTEAWVVNHVSGSVSVVDLVALRVQATLQTLAEPADVVFARGASDQVRGTEAYVSCSVSNSVQVFDSGSLGAAPVVIELRGEEPKAMAVRPGGNEIYVALFESGNRTTALGGGVDEGVGNVVIPPNVVSHPDGPHRGVNPPPNDGNDFLPRLRPGNPPPPAVGLIVRQDGEGAWRDDTDADWTELVNGGKAALSGRVRDWELLDHDVAIIDTRTREVSYVTDCMNMCMAIGVRGRAGQVIVVGTDATNEIRFEPILKGRFLRVNLAAFPGGDVADRPAVIDLNPHLTYRVPSIPRAEREQSLGDPRGIAIDEVSERVYVTGMGSNNVAVLNDRFGRVGLVTVGEGPTGIVLAHNGSRAYVLNRFEMTISTINTATLQEVSKVALFDPTPDAIRDGRRHLYDTHRNSGLGHISCASCHVDARLDRLAWDLGDPSGEVKEMNQACFTDSIQECEDFHPMKGPMLTQTLRDIIGKEPHHWRGDRDGLEEFAGAFVGLLGGDAQPSATDMQEFEDFLATIHYPPNPFRNFDNTLPRDLEMPGHFTPGRFGPDGRPLPNGDAVRGLDAYRNASLDGGVPGFQCVTCHTLPTGIGPDVTSGPGGTLVPNPVGPNGELHHALVSVDGSTNVSMKIAQMRNLYERVGFDLTQPTSLNGFGYTHDGSVDSMARFVAEPVFTVTSTQQIADLVAFMLAFSGSDLPDARGTLNEQPGPESTDTHAAVGKQLTIAAARDDARLQEFVDLAETGAVELVAKASARGWVYDPARRVFLSDVDNETNTLTELKSQSASDNPITFTIVPVGMGRRVGIDRDGDGFGDGTEVAAGSDPADSADTP